MSKEFWRYFFPFHFQMKVFFLPVRGGWYGGWLCMQLLDFYCHPEFCSLVSSLHASRVWNRLQYCTVERRQTGDAGKAEFQSASPCEQRVASRLWPLMPPGRAITSCAHWQQQKKKGTTFPTMPSVCLRQTPAAPEGASQWLNWERSPWKIKPINWPYKVFGYIHVQDINLKMKMSYVQPQQMHFHCSHAFINIVNK